MEPNFTKNNDNFHDIVVSSISIEYQFSWISLLSWSMNEVFIKVQFLIIHLHCTEWSLFMNLRILKTMIVIKSTKINAYEILMKPQWFFCTNLSLFSARDCNWSYQRMSSSLLLKNTNFRFLEEWKIHSSIQILIGLKILSFHSQAPQHHGKCFCID